MSAKALAGGLHQVDLLGQLRDGRCRAAQRHGKALGVVKHSIICCCWHMLSTDELYRDLGGDFYRRRDPKRQTRRLIAQLQTLGHGVTLQ